MRRDAVNDAEDHESEHPEGGESDSPAAPPALSQARQGEAKCRRQSGSSR